jgi:small conductance mechanosensitive channel
MYKNFIFCGAALVDDVDVASIDASDLTPGALENFLRSLAPSLQELAFNLVAALIIFLVGRKLIKLLLKLLDKFLGHTSVDAGVSSFLMSASRVLLYIFLFFMIVGQLGVNTASIVTVLGAAGLAISMSLQGSLSNVAGGILILLMKPFKVGDYVSTTYGDGTVRSIGLVYTTMVTPDNRVLTVPNGTLSNSAVFDFSAMEVRRLDISAGISYSADLLRAKQIMEQVYRDCPSVDAERGIDVHVMSLADSAVVLEAYGWVPCADYLKAKWSVTEQIKLRFDAEGIGIPFPQMDVHLDPPAKRPETAEKASK